MKKQNKTAETNCESCAYYNYDDETGLYVCAMALDEDEMIQFLRGKFYACPYYRLYDEYAIVRKQN